MAGRNDDKRLRMTPSVGKDAVEGDVLKSYSDPAGTRYRARSAGAAIDMFMSDVNLKTDTVEIEQVDERRGASVLRRKFQQRLNGLRVVGSTLQVVADTNSKGVVSASNTLEYDVDDAPDPSQAQSIDAVTPAVLAPFDGYFESSEVTASELAYLRYDDRPAVPEDDYPTAPRAVLEPGREPDRQLHLVYVAQVATWGPEENFEVIVDAVDGDVLYVRLLGAYVTATMNAYQPDPVSQSNDGTLSSSSSAATLNPFRHPVTAEINPAVNGKFRLEGEWARCNDFDGPTFAQPEENAASFSYETEPADRRFLSANAYYWLDTLVRYLRGLGVQEFNDNVVRVDVDPQAFNGADQSEWQPASNRIRLGEGGVPDAADMAVVVHEYTHAIFTFLGSSHGGSVSYEHSICDALPAIFRDRFNANGHRRTETFPWDNNATNQWSAVRRLDRAERFDDPNFNNLSFNVKNSMLGTALWNCYEGMNGFSTHVETRKQAADAMIRTMMEMLLIVPDDSSNTVAHARSMADGCITADTALTGGLYSKVMYEAFVDQGLYAKRPVDVYVSDSDTDSGDLPSPVPHWTSPDIWVRNNPPPANPNDPNDPNAGENPDAGHQPPINGQPNYVHVRVRNRGTQQADANEFSVEVFRCDPSTGAIWPNHFNSIGTLPITTAIPANGGSVRVGPFIWTPQIVGHECLLAVVHGPDDPAITKTLIGSVEHWKMVRFDNNVGQRNVSPQMSVGGGKTKATIFMRGGLTPSTNQLLLDASAMPSDTKIHVRTLRRVVDPATRQHLSVEEETKVWSTLEMAGAKVGELNGFPLSKDDRVSVELTIDFSVKGEHLKVYPLVCIQEQDGEVAGRMTVEITAVKELEDFVFANPRSGELHISTCPFWDAIGPGNKVPYQSIEDGLARGYNGCAYCLPDHDTG
ncbi:MAG TPA: hypothetical protein VHI71_04280 [Actinomycetota bacterium]|nr:hypothetical protein [Actinomycetota bacterium]